MNLSLRDVLVRQANHATLPAPDIEELVGLGEKRLRRRRIAAVVGGVGAGVVALALVLSVTNSGPVKHGEVPVNQPTSSPSRDDTAHGPARRVLYANHLGGDESIHWGERAVDANGGRVHMDVTDDAFVYTTEEGRLWFSAGGAPEQIGSHVCGRSAVPHNIGAYEQDSVMSGNSGSWVAWFECPKIRGATLVVFDTSIGREVARQRIASCKRYDGCRLIGVIGDHVYFERPPDDKVASFDVTTGQENSSAPQSYADDIRSRPRGLVVGDSWRSGTPTDGIEQRFDVVGSQLVPMSAESPGQDVNQVHSRAFDTGTGAELQLHLADGYHPNNDHLGEGAGPPLGFSLFEWLDDDTIALAYVGGSSSGDIITCQISDRRCTLAVHAPQQGTRIFPHQILPG